MVTRIRSQGKRRLAISTCVDALGESSWPLYTAYVYMALS